MKTTFTAKIIYESSKDDPDYYSLTLREMHQKIRSGEAQITEVIDGFLVTDELPVIVFKENNE